MSTYDFSTLNTTLPHNLIKKKLINLIETTFQREGTLYLACNDKIAFFTSDYQKRFKRWSCQNVCDAFIYLLDNIFIRFGTKLHRQIVGISIGTNCAPLVAELFLFCYERDSMMSLSDDTVCHHYSLQRKPLPNGSETPAKLCVLPAFEHRFLKLMSLKHLIQRLDIWTTF